MSPFSLGKKSAIEEAGDRERKKIPIEGHALGNACSLWELMAIKEVSPTASPQLSGQEEAPAPGGNAAS